MKDPHDINSNHRLELYTRLEVDGNYRCRLVELLREAAAIIKNGGVTWCSTEPHPMPIQPRMKMTRRLTALAAHLCDHDRVNTDGSCRYCSTPDVEADELKRVQPKATTIS